MKLYARLLLIVKRIVYYLYLPVAVIISLFVNSAAFNLISAAVCTLILFIYNFFKKKHPEDFGGDQYPVSKSNMSYWYIPPLVFSILWLIKRCISAFPPNYLEDIFSKF